MSISPKTSIYVNLIAALLLAVVNGVISFSGLVPDPVNHAIITWATFALSVYGVINAALHSVSSPSDGPLTNVQIRIEKMPPKESLAVALVFGLVAAIGLSFGTALPVEAAQKTSKVGLAHHGKGGVLHRVQPAKVKRALAPKHIVAAPVVSDVYPAFAPIGTPLNTAAQLTAQPAWDAQPAPIAAVQPAPMLSTSLKMNSAISDVWKKLQAVTLSDLQYANNLALSNQDQIASTCYSALITLIQKSQLANIDPATGQPMALPSVHLVTDLENVIIIYRELQPTSATSVACAALANNLKVGSMSALLTGLGTGGLASGLLLP